MVRRNSIWVSLRSKSISQTKSNCQWKYDRHRKLLLLCFDIKFQIKWYRHKISREPHRKEIQTSGCHLCLRGKWAQALSKLSPLTPKSDSILYFPTLSPMNFTLRSRVKWTAYQLKNLDCYTNSPWQHLMKCWENSRENMHTNVRL